MKTGRFPVSGQIQRLVVGKATGPETFTAPALLVRVNQGDGFAGALVVVWATVFVVPVAYLLTGLPSMSCRLL